MVECRIPNEFALIEEGILTKDKIRKYPLSKLNVNRLVKIYAINTKQSYTLNYYTEDRYIESEYYITDKGKELFFDFIENHDILFIKKYIFIRLTSDNKNNIRNYNCAASVINQLLGECAVRGSQGKNTQTKIVFTKGSMVQEKIYPSIREGRNALTLLLTMYDPECFKIYRKRTQIKRGYSSSWWVEMPLFKR